MRYFFFGKIRNNATAKHMYNKVEYLKQNNSLIERSHIIYI